MLTDLGADVYAGDFERPFLDQARQFYRMEAQSFLATSDCPEYLRKAERRLAEEGERVKLYLDPTTEPKITKVLEAELIAAQVSVLGGGGGVSPGCVSVSDLRWSGVSGPRPGSFAAWLVKKDTCWVPSRPPHHWAGRVEQ
jgi:hypothetical protein